MVETAFKENVLHFNQACFKQMLISLVGDGQYSCLASYDVNRVFYNFASVPSMRPPD